MSTIYTKEEVAKHKSHNDCWLIYKGKVYNVTQFLGDHPGGEEVLLDSAGTKFLWKINSSQQDEIPQRILTMLDTLKMQLN